MRAIRIQAIQPVSHWLDGPFKDMGLSGPFQRLDVLGFKKTLKIALQASDTVRQAITALLLDGYTGVQIDRKFIPNLGGL